MSKILVTGGAGFIGSHFTRYWLKNYPDDQVINLDALTYAASPESLHDIEKDPNYTFIKGDVTDPTTINKALEGVDVVVHFAAETHNDRAIIDLKPFINTNITGTHVLLEAVKNKNIHFHHISTDEVFGHLELNSDQKFSESTPYYPRMPYAATKAASDHLVRSYFETFNVPITITNCSNNYGPYMHPEKFIPRMITNLIDGQTIKIYGDGQYIRDWLYVQDHCRAIDFILQSGKVGETYLVGGLEDDVNNLEVAQQILDLLGESADKIEFVKDRPGHDRRYAVNWGKIQRQLGWEPEYDFTQHLAATITWYQDNQWWWRPLKKEAEKIYQ